MTTHNALRYLLASAIFLAATLVSSARAEEGSTGLLDSRQLASQVTIYRDAYGMPHIDGKNDQATVFGFGYCQAEDYFWQLEDSYALGLGRYAELYGKQFLAKDLRNRAFEVPQCAKADFDKLEPQPRLSGMAFVAGINYYLDTHPQVKPRMLTRIEPGTCWPLHAATLELVGSHTHVSTGEIPTDFQQRKLEEEVREATGSNAWAISGSKTRSGKAMLLINPHQPYYGFGQFYEAHLRRRRLELYRRLVFWHAAAGAGAQ